MCKRKSWTSDSNSVQTRVIISLNFDKYAKMHEQSRRVYSPSGIAPTVHTCGGGGQEPKVIIWEK